MCTEISDENEDDDSNEMSLSLYCRQSSRSSRWLQASRSRSEAPLSETPTAPLIGVLHVQASHRDTKDVKNNPMMNLASFSLSSSGTRLSVTRQLYLKRLAAKCAC